VSEPSSTGKVSMATGPFSPIFDVLGPHNIVVHDLPGPIHRRPRVTSAWAITARLAACLPIFPG